MFAIGHMSEYDGGDLDEYIERPAGTILRRKRNWSVASGSGRQRRNTTSSRAETGGNFSDVGRREDVQGDPKKTRTHNNCH